MIETVKSPKYGFKVSYLSDDKYIGRHAKYDGIEPVVASLFHQLVQPNDFVFDLGANIGFYSLLSCDKGATVAAFEPESTSYALLAHNLRQNDFSFYHTVLAGVGKESGFKYVRRSDINYGDHRIVEEAEEGNLITYCYSLNDAVEDYGIPSVIKSDIQGYEFEAFQEYEHFDRCKLLFTEFSIDMPPFAGHEEEFLDLLKSNFPVVHIIDDQRKNHYAVESVAHIHNLIKRWGHTHANLLCHK